MIRPFKIACFSALCVFLAIFVGMSTGCKKEKFITDPSAQLEFSEDTIIFDTVFTTVGSVTQVLKIYNRHKGILTVNDLFIESGQNSNYRLNVDGIPGKSFTNIEVPAEDSLFIFVEVTVDPNSATTPLIVSDKIIFRTNGNEQKVDLVAWGQDAYFFKPGPGSNAFYMPCNVTLLTDKPNVFYGYGIVDENCDLTIPAGARLHFHPGSGIIVYKGSLNVNGTVSSKVTFEGDRLEYDYRDVSGQWEGIRMIQPQTSNIKHAVIKNGFYGLWIDTTYSNTQIVNIEKTEITNMASLGIYVNAGARINAVNCLVNNCGLYAIALTYGGDITINHCTFANYWTESTRSTPAFYCKNWFETSTGDNIRDLNLTFDNCIVYGNLIEEFVTDLQTATVMNYNFRNCFIKTEADVSDATHFTDISKNVDPLFEDVTKRKFKLLAGSPCIGAASSFGSVLDDIDDKVRDGDPDVGCYEF